MIRFGASLLLLILFQPAWANGAPPVCTHEQASAAEDEADNLNDAETIYHSYLRFKQCDDGSIAEGYSDSIARLLADHWSEVERLNHLTAAHKDFERFVLRHLDETMTQEQAQTILSNARERCPVKAKRLCRLIEKAVTR